MHEGKNANAVREFSARRGSLAEKLDRMHEAEAERHHAPDAPRFGSVNISPIFQRIRSNQLA